MPKKKNTISRDGHCFGRYSFNNHFGKFKMELLTYCRDEVKRLLRILLAYDEYNVTMTEGFGCFKSFMTHRTGIIRERGDFE